MILFTTEVTEGTEEDKENRKIQTEDTTARNCPPKAPRKARVNINFGLEADGFLSLAFLATWRLDGP